MGLSLNNKNQVTDTGCMNYFLKRELKTKSKNDRRFTLILVIGSVFLFFSFMQIIGTDKQDEVINGSYSLKVTGGSLSVMPLGGSEIKTSTIPWNLTPFFFEKLPINEADKETLKTIKGIGPKLAENILQHRLEYGPFKESADLLKISGVGPKRALYFEKMFDFGGK